MQTVTPRKKRRPRGPFTTLNRTNGLQSMDVLNTHIDAVHDYILAHPHRHASQIAIGIAQMDGPSIARSVVNAILEEPTLGPNRLVQQGKVLLINPDHQGRQPQWFKNLSPQMQEQIKATKPVEEDNGRPQNVTDPELMVKYNDAVDGPLYLLRKSPQSPRKIVAAIRSLTLSAAGLSIAAHTNALEITKREGKIALLIDKLNRAEAVCDRYEGLMGKLLKDDGGSAPAALPAPAV